MARDVRSKTMSSILGLCPSQKTGKNMTKLKIDLVEAGMIVARDVKNMDNMLLIPAGCALTSRQITILRAWGVEEIDVAAAQARENFKWKLAPDESIGAAFRNRFCPAEDANPA
jgi:hypothetical protein